MHNDSKHELRKPEWFKDLVRKRDTIHFVDQLADGEKVFTVCESAKCPNRGECFRNGTLTFMILGGVCTRACRFCAVEGGKPEPINHREIQTILNIIGRLKLKYTVITSVSRDDLADGGASHFANIIHAIHKAYPETKVEVLTPDFKGNIDDLHTVLEARPFVFNHNIETVARLYPYVRPQADYNRSLNVLNQSKALYPEIQVKSGIMLGLGETFDEVISTFQDIRRTGCDFLTVGHYIQPSRRHYPIQKYYEREDFVKLDEIAREMGFKHVVSMPFARSSYLAHTYQKG